jgi:thiol-disulfide isomerase/thioredoxin
MSKAVRARQQSAREKIAAQQASARRGEQRRKIMIAGGSAALVLVIVVALVIVKLAGGSASPAGGTSAGSANVAASVSHKIATVPAAALNLVGAGPAYPAPGSVYPNAVKTIKAGDPLLISNGKPEIVYVGGEYCPYCAAERWALAVALSRFGTFSGLRLIHSSSSDVDPSTPTLSFYKSTYQSKYLTFAPTEAQDVNRAPLQPLTALDKSLMTRYDAPPYVPKAYSGSFPFVDFGNRYVIDGASYDPAVLANLTWEQIAADLAKPSSTVARAIDGSANHITAAICKITHNQPGAVCTSTGVTSASGSI